MLVLISFFILTRTLSCLSVPLSEYKSNCLVSRVKQNINNGADVIIRGIGLGNNAIQLVEGLKADTTNFITGLTRAAVSNSVNLSSQGLDGATGVARQTLGLLNLLVNIFGHPVGQAFTKFLTDIGKYKLQKLNEYGQNGLNMFDNYLQNKLQGINTLAQRKHAIVSKLSHDTSVLGQSAVSAGADALKSVVDIGSLTLNNIFRVQ